MLPMHIICLSTLLLCGHIISGSGPRVAGPSLGWQQSLAHSAACYVVWLWARSCVLLVAACNKREHSAACCVVWLWTRFHVLLAAACNKREQEPRSDLQ